MSWTEAQIEKLRTMADSRRYLFTEIANAVGKSAQTTRWKARRLGLNTRPPAGRVGKWNAKHAHLREQVMTFFLTHTWDQTAKKFSLTRSELKSLFSVGYRDPKLKHLRKDRRRHDPWTVDELLLAVRSSGVRPRSWIGEKLERGKARVVKERFKTFNSGTKWLNGMPKKWADELWPGCKIDWIKTDAGPTGGKFRGNFQFVIVPWTECEKIMKYRHTRWNVRRCIRAMAKFQRWIHGVNDPRWIKRKLRESLKQ